MRPYLRYDRYFTDCTVFVNQKESDVRRLTKVPHSGIFVPEKFFLMIKSHWRAIMNRLSLQEAMNLLGVEDVDGTHGQLERLRRWVEGLVERHGNEYVSENRCKLLD